MLIIPKSDQYLIMGDSFFQLRTNDLTLRDIYITLSKNTVNVLKQLAKEARIKGFSKMKKDQLLQSLTGLIIFR